MSMKKMKRWLCGLLSAALCLSMAGCSQGDAGKPELANTTVKLLMWTNPSQTDQKLFEKFEQDTGIKLDVTVTAWEDCWQKLANGVATGDTADVTMLFGAYFPKFVIKNLFQPIDEYWDKDDPLWNTEQMEEYKWKDKHYAFCSNDAASTTFQSIMPLYLYYNKSMLENAGLEDPVQLEAEGRWNWDTFRQMLKELTIDSNNDGKLDQWGLGRDGYVYSGYIQSNNTGFNKVMPDGSVKLNFSDPALAEALQYIYDITKKDKALGEGEFSKGTAAFRIQGEDGARTFSQLNVDFKWDFVNIPYGPNNTDKKSAGAWLSGLGVVNGAKNPEGAVAFIKYILDKKNAVTTDEFTEEQTQRIKQSKENCVLQDDRYDYQSIYTILTLILDQNRTVAAALKEQEKKWASGILKTMEGTGIITLAEGVPFKGMEKIDFEDGGFGPLRIPEGDGIRAEISSKPDEVVAGQYSLILSGGKGKATPFAEVDPEKINKIEPGNIYNISISYRILEDFQDEMGNLQFSLADDEVKIGESGEISGAQGDSGTATLEVQFVDNLEKVRLKIEGIDVGKVAIDDITITAHK